MTRLLLALVVLLGLAAVAEAAHRSLFGRVRERVAVRERYIERGPLMRLRGGAGCAGIQAGGCIGTSRGGCAGVTVSAGCSGYVGPALAPPAVKVVPAPMPGTYWPGTVPWKK